MITKNALLAVTVFMFTVPVVPAFAHDDGGYNKHARDHVEHGRFHRDVAEAHERAHDEGFTSRAEHRAYHRALRDVHGEFHEDHPNTRHDHYRWWRRWH